MSKPEKELPLKGVLCYADSSAAGASRPAFWKDDKTGVYKFDTYGAAPFNFKKWKTHGYGSCGGRGETEDRQLLIEALKGENERGEVACVHMSLVDECIKLGASFTSSDARVKRNRFVVKEGAIFDTLKNEKIFSFSKNHEYTAKRISAHMNHNSDAWSGL